MKNFKQIEADIDYNVSERILIGRLTKLRYNALDRYCRASTFRAGNCGHEYDCCGCLSSQSLTFEHKHNRTVLTLSLTFNY